MKVTFDEDKLWSDVTSGHFEGSLAEEVDRGVERIGFLVAAVVW
jgi:hypothetical protein